MTQTQGEQISRSPQNWRQTGITGGETKFPDGEKADEFLKVSCKKIQNIYCELWRRKMWTRLLQGDPYWNRTRNKPWSTTSHQVWEITSSMKILTRRNTRILSQRTKFLTKYSTKVADTKFKDLRRFAKLDKDRKQFCTVLLPSTRSTKHA